MTKPHVGRAVEAELLDPPGQAEIPAAETAIPALPFPAVKLKFAYDRKNPDAPNPAAVSRLIHQASVVETPDHAGNDQGGALSFRPAAALPAVSAARLVLAAWELNPLAFKLSPVALGLLLLYSYTKRYTLLSHIVLGTCLGISPVAAWIALRGDVSWSVVILGAAVTLWVAGFDIIYACQDVAFDRAMDLHSIPKKFGITAALYASAALHVLMLALLVLVAQVSGLGWIALGGLALVAALLAYEHLLVKPSDLSRVNAAFFTINGYISVLFFLTWAAAILIR